MGRQDLRRQGCKRFYPEKLLEGETLRLLSSLQIDEAFWAERNAAWQTELAEVKGELLAIENAPPKADLLAAARKPVELLQVAPTLYVTQDPAEKARLLKTMVSNYTIIDGSVSVVLRSPFDVLARGARTGEWWARQGSNLRQPV